MTEDEALADRVRRALATTPGVEERRMFGSLGFLVEGTLRIAVGVHGDRVAMVRTGAAQDAALQRPGTAPMVMRGRELTGWISLSRTAIVTDEDVEHWVGVALAAVEPGKVSPALDRDGTPGGPAAVVDDPLAD